MSFKDNIIRLNIISGNIVKLQTYEVKRHNKLSRMLYRAYLLITDFIIGIPKMKSIIKNMNCGDPSQRPIKLAAVVIAKNESEYIAEWVAYHIVQGFEKIYLYDNDSTDNMKECLQPFIDKGIVVNLQGIKRVAVNRFFSSNEDILYSEVMKYLYLIFSDSSYFSPLEWTYNSNGQPLRMISANSMNKMEPIINKFFENQK